MRKEEQRVALSYRKREDKDDAFVVRVALDTMQRVFEQSTGIPLNEELIRQQIDSNTTTVIVENHGHPVGYYSYTTFSAGGMYLSALVLAPKVQNMGVGTRVAAHLEQEARLLGIHSIHAHVQFTNTGAIIFWLKNGYRIRDSRMNGMLAIEKTLTRNTQPHRVGTDVRQ